MRFALLGNHLDGLNMARALMESGRHTLVCYHGPSQSSDELRRLEPNLSIIGDLEEVLADPSIEVLIVAGALEDRPLQLRRALQSERHVICVHPPDKSPDIAYEAAMIQADTGQVLLPLLTEALHPAVRRLAAWLHSADKRGGAIRFISWQRRQALADEAKGRNRNQEPSGSFSGWGILRALGGEIAEVSAFAEEEFLIPGRPLLLSGRFEHGGLFQATNLPETGESNWFLRIFAGEGEAGLVWCADLIWCNAPLGKVILSGGVGETGNYLEEKWDDWNPWPELVNIFESTLANLRIQGIEGGEKGDEGQTKAKANNDGILKDSLPAVGSSPPLSWQDAIRSLELDDALRRSIERRRTSFLEYPEASEEVGFKGTMTLMGCGLLWVLVLLLVLSRWYPTLGWLILPLLVVFLALQLLRWVARKERV